MGNTRGLTDKPITPEVVEEDGRVVATHLNTVVTDPTSANAVQVPDGDVYPTANATQHDPLAAHTAADPADAYDDDETSVNEIQSVTLSDATAGTFTLTFDGETTTAIAYNAAASAVRDALVALSSVGNDGEGNPNVTVSGSAGGPYTVTFVNDLGAQSVSEMTASATGLTDEVATATVVETTPGAP